MNNYLQTRMTFLHEKTMGTREEKLAMMFQERITSWKEGQIGQSDGYEYERSFAEMMRQMEEDVFKEMTGTELKNKNKKKRC